MLGVEGPTLGVGRVLLELAEFRDVLQLLLNGNLQVMAGNALVISDRLDAVEVAVSGILCVNE